MKLSYSGSSRARFGRGALVATLTGLTASAACGGSTATTATGACSDYAQSICNELAQCDTIDLQIEYAGSSSACVSSLAAECTGALQIPGTAITPAWVEACGKAIDAQSCEESATKSPAACIAPPGTLADGQSCLSDAQCKGGTCKTPVPAESEDAGAGDGIPCGTCTEKVTSATCEEDSDCPGDQVCSFGSATPGGTLTSSCVTPGAAGAACSASAPCEGTLTCPGNGASADAVCTALATLGQPCSGADVVGSGGCANGLVCGGDNTCQTPTYVTPGGACTLANEICAGGSCVGGRCFAFGGEGSACGPASDPECGPGLECNNEKCASLIAANAMCGN